MSASPFDLASIAARLSSLPGTPHVPAPGPNAAVAAILRDEREAGGGAEVLLIRRAEREGDPWSGHMAFPGGRRDAADPDLHTTAVRETREEVGIDLAAGGALLGRLPDLPAIARAPKKRTGMTITPFVFSLSREVPLTFDPGEVAEALWVPIAPLARNEGAGTVSWEREGVTVDLPCWHVHGHVVWGLTHRMLTMLFEVLQA